MTEPIITVEQGLSTWQGPTSKAPPTERRAGLRRLLRDLREELQALHRIEASARARARAATREVFEVRRRLGE